MKKIFVTKSSMPSFTEYTEEIKEMWDTHMLTNMGIKHKTLQRKLQEYLGVEHIELITNGHMALELTLQAMKIKGEVITTPFTFASTTHAIVRNGLDPVFCDIDPVTFTIDVEKIDKLITNRTSAILPVHVYGNICDINEIDKVARKYNLKVVYDAAHAFGETYNNIGIGSFGDASCFSFHATKVFNTIEGGAVCYNEKIIGDYLYDLKNFGIHGPENVTAVGANAKMNEFCAAMGICNLKHIEDEINKRKKVVERYYENFDGLKGIRLNKIQSNVKSNYSYFPIFVDESIFGYTREHVAKALEAKGIYTRKYFYPLTNEFEAYKGRFSSQDTPVARHLSRQVLSLPLYSDLKMDEVDMICNTIRSIKV